MWEGGREKKGGEASSAVRGLPFRAHRSESEEDISGAQAKIVVDQFMQREREKEAVLWCGRSLICSQMQGR